MNKKTAEHYMHRCLDLAQKGLGTTYPNPLVGAVIVYQDNIIGEGWHQEAGGPHAEVTAINNVQDKSLLSKSTLYVNLEPCSHHGKTPPCVDLIKSHSIPKIVVGSLDPNPKVSGKGIATLQKWGCEVIQGVLNNEADFLNRRFFTYHIQKRPYILLKWAETEDGFIAPLQETKEKPQVFWISNTLSRQRVHQWRSQETALLIGVQTLIYDNPNLTTRHWKGPNPLRIVLDPTNRTPKNATVNRDENPTLFFNREKLISSGNKIHIQLKPFTLENVLAYCYSKEIQSILVEGGKVTLERFIKEGLWDEARVFKANKILKTGIAAPLFEFEENLKETIGGDVLKTYFKQTYQAII